MSKDKSNPIIEFLKKTLVLATIILVPFFLIQWTIIQILQKIGILDWFI